jgi:hypothetical protein
VRAASSSAAAALSSAALQIQVEGVDTLHSRELEYDRALQYVVDSRDELFGIGDEDPRGYLIDVGLDS